MRLHKAVLACLAAAIVAILIGIALTNWWIQRPQRIKAAFVGHLSHERYEEAALMLHAPSAIKLGSDGEVILVDRVGNSTAVPEARLPFLVGGGEPNGPGDFSMTALQGSKNGWVKGPVILYLSINAGKIRIESVDSL